MRLLGAAAKDEVLLSQKHNRIILADLCFLPSAVNLLLIRMTNVGWTPAHTGEIKKQRDAGWMRKKNDN